MRLKYFIFLVWSNIILINPILYRFYQIISTSFIVINIVFTLYDWQNLIVIEYSNKNITI